LPIRSWPLDTVAVMPVPPTVAGSAEVPYPIAKVPDDVIGVPVTWRNGGTVRPADVTVPAFVAAMVMEPEPGVIAIPDPAVNPVRVYPLLALPIRILPDVGVVVTPVPPFATGRAVPDKDIARVPATVMGEPATVRKDGTVAETEVTVPVPPPPPPPDEEIVMEPELLVMVTLAPAEMGARVNPPLELPIGMYPTPGAVVVPRPPWAGTSGRARVSK
jgi:hypothetical protein